MSGLNVHVHLSVLSLSFMDNSYPEREEIVHHLHVSLCCTRIYSILRNSAQKASRGDVNTYNTQNNSFDYEQHKDKMAGRQAYLSFSLQSAHE